MSKKMIIIFDIIINIVMALAMSIGASLIHGGINTMTWILVPVAFVIGMLISLIIPLNKIGNWFSNLFKIKPQSILSIIVSNIIINIITTIIMSFCMTNISLNFQYPLVALAWLGDLPILYLISYVVSLITNIVWFIVVIPHYMERRKNV